MVHTGGASSTMIHQTRFYVMILSVLQSVQVLDLGILDYKLHLLLVSKH